MKWIKWFIYVLLKLAPLQHSRTQITCIINTYIYNNTNGHTILQNIILQTHAIIIILAISTKLHEETNNVASKVANIL